MVKKMNKAATVPSAGQRFILLILFFGLSSLLWAQEDLEFDALVYSKIFSYERAETPEYWNNRVIFTYANSDKAVRYVAAVFEHEDYSRKHVFFKKVGDGTAAGAEGEPIFILLYDPGDQETLRYRLIVDGLWQSDPMAMAQQRDDFGNEISVYRLPLDRPKLVNSPVPGEDGRITFFYRGNPGDRVALMGNFNSWDPFMHPLREDPKDPGLFSINLRVTPGNVYYYFLVGTQKVLDQLNPEEAVDPAGNKVSYYFFGPENLAAAPVR
jgi:hypothetical protein